MVMKFIKEAFIDHEKWIVVLYVDILVYANTTNEIYDVHDLNKVSKTSKTWLGFSSVKFLSYKIMRPNIELTQDPKNNTQAIHFPENTKTMQLFYISIVKKFRAKLLMICSDTT
jgi:hypothetical protein